jgi:hypothetical protein
MASGFDHSDLSDPSHPLLAICPSARLLTSVIPLPHEPCIAYSIFIPLQNDPFHCQNSMELARRQILIRNKSLSLLQSCLPRVHISREPALYVFLITSHDCVAQSLSTLNDLHLDGLLGERNSLAFYSLFFFWHVRAGHGSNPKPRASMDSEQSNLFSVQRQKHPHSQPMVSTLALRHVRPKEYLAPHV